MTEGTNKTFEPDAYIEHLIVLREQDLIKYSALPDAAKQVIEEYEREKESATFACHQGDSV